MPKAREWSKSADQTIRQMRAQGATWAAIGCALGLSRNTIIERGRRLQASAPARAATPKPQVDVPDDPNREPLPAGHPRTWGLLTDAAYPTGENL